MDQEQLAAFEVSTRHFNRIMIAIDDDDFISSRFAFDYACTVAKIYSIPLAIASVLETGDLNVFQSLDPDVLSERRNEIAKDLNVYVEKAKKAGILDVVPMIGEGKPGRVVVEQMIPQFKPDLVVVGSETHSGARKTIGSVAAHITRFSPCSVIVVRDPASVPVPKTEN
ncbi:MAG: universal stress protein [Schleiferilactobacillus perolens]|jgi:nucleotide-binding universal stress UspA family protein|uniref:universal stress protein n=1 Tax=Schleiferilactobacillus perolens TaxID=100468 RepID=UPI0039EBC11C|nr:universal stress protein [Schleiferilactobacillus harbinensis]MCI1911547.1 universal stress protein [Schleiferilactobacillus harbinensis]